MTNNYCTLFDSNYIAFGMNLIESLKEHDENGIIYVITLDMNAHDELIRLNFNNVVLIDVSDIEKAYPQLKIIKPKRSKAEYFFTLSPAVCKYIMELFTDIKRLTYLDSDLYFFSSPSPLFEEISDSSIAIIEHRFSFLTRSNIKYGRFNVGWISFSRDDQGLECLNKWYHDCVEWCFQKVEPKRYADQKYLDIWPLNYRNLKIIKHKGANLAPWNIANYKIKKINNQVYVDEDKLIFFHFANIKQIGVLTFKTNLSRVLVRTSGIIKEDIYIPYLKSLSEKLQKRYLKILSKKDINHKSFFINILVKLYRSLRDLIYNDIIELK
ncbi:hypothetical protein N9D33_01015 [Flavobacteriaceae bacterium]|nr:hypothetical protein [Flavobacteriaceae bacterium]